MRLTVTLCVTIAALVGWSLPAMAQAAAPAGNPLTDPHHIAGVGAAGGVGMGGTRLNHGDRVVIQAPSIADPDGTTCVSLENTTGRMLGGVQQSKPIDYFVPWNTATEWSAFQNAVKPPDGSSSLLPNVTSTSYCCQPSLGNPLVAPMCNTPLPELGQRWLGLPSGDSLSSTGNDIPWYGAAGDVITFYAVPVAGSNPPTVTFAVGAPPAGDTISAQVTYECMLNGSGIPTWNESNGMVGSCSALPGICAGPSLSFTTLASPPDPTTLCGNNSILTNLTGGTTGPWTWQCNGTPNMSPGTPCPAGDTVGGDGSCDASCSATVGSPPASAACGPVAGTYVATAPTDPAQLCSSGAMGMFFSLNLIDSTQPPYEWDCNGTDGSQQWCTSNPPAGATTPSCGYDNYQVLASLPTDPSAFCIPPAVLAVGFPITGGGQPPWATPNDWYWECADPTGVYANNWCVAFGSATCGWDDEQSTYGAPDPWNLCMAGTASPLILSGSIYSWTCTLTNNGSTTSQSCSETTVASSPPSPPVSPPGDVTGVCGSSNGLTIPEPTTNLCSSGTATALAGSGPWTWTCQGSGTGSNSPLCTAYPCLACVGTIAGQSRSYSRTSSGGGCNITGTAQWTETDVLTSSAPSTTISWSDSVGSFTQALAPISAVSNGYCGPCYQQLPSAANVQNPTTLISSANGNCPGIAPGDSIPGIGVSVQ